MKLDRTFIREIKKTANGDGSRDARIAFLRQGRSAARKMSTPKVMRQFDDAVREYGRATVALCVAVTAYANRDRLCNRTVRWALAVLKLWTNKPRDIMHLLIHDNLHPTSIEEYAGSLITVTIEEE